jgi:hypothetical protein
MSCATTVQCFAMAASLPKDETGKDKQIAALTALQEEQKSEPNPRCHLAPGHLNAPTLQTSRTWGLGVVGRSSFPALPHQTPRNLPKRSRTSREHGLPHTILYGAGGLGVSSGQASLVASHGFLSPYRTARERTGRRAAAP